MAHATITPHNAEEETSATSKKMLALALGSIGVVYGDIGTSHCMPSRKR